MTITIFVGVVIRLASLYRHLKYHLTIKNRIKNNKVLLQKCKKFIIRTEKWNVLIHIKYDKASKVILESLNRSPGNT